MNHQLPTMVNHRLWVLSGAVVLLLGTATMPAIADTQTLTFDLAQTQPSLQPRQRWDGQREGRGPGHRRIDFAAAAARLGTTEANLRQALGLPAQPLAEGDRPNRGARMTERLQQAAAQLNVSEERLRQALGITLDPQTGQLVRPTTRPNLQTAAAQLGVTEEQLRNALGRPGGERHGEGRRPRLDIRGAATRLGLTEQQLLDALGIQRRPMYNQPNQPNQQRQSTSNRMG
ncbi:MAG TPA: hypothetical protein IGS37_14535 [Synechococcales cyanobacterium M55_K2018_004]|nr:hypothetical protein [Synechococcales cyanobacterium M55_K2018_004]